MSFYGIMGVYITPDLRFASTLSGFFYGLWCEPCRRRARPCPCFGLPRFARPVVRLCQGRMRPCPRDKRAMCEVSAAYGAALVRGALPCTPLTPC